MKEKITLDISKLNPSSINELTEIASGYKLLNINLVDFYSGLHPSGLSKIANILFSCILFNKIYKRPDAKGYSEEEAKRIFTTILVQPDDLAKRIHPVKYADGEKETDNDISNILKALNELEDLNIFYIWKFKQPYTFIFVMERDVGSWKYYNPKGVVYPKSIKKIIRLGKSMIDTMESLERQRGRVTSRSSIEDSFGEFINKLIDKMNPDIASTLTRWKEGTNIFSFTSTLSGELKRLNDYEGFAYDEMFVKRLPEHIRSKVIKNNKEAIVHQTSVEMDLVPKDGNLVKLKKVKKDIPKDRIVEIATEVETKEPLLANTIKYRPCDPLKNATEFTKYYRSFMRMYNKESKFYGFAQEVLYAADVLDLMLLNGRMSLKFLKAWMRFYAVETLKDDNATKEDKTSIASFKKTFNSYNQNYLG